MLAAVFYGCCAALPTYGKDAEGLTNALRMFNMVLSDYTGEQIKQAFLYWLKTNRTFPTPADIVSLILRPGKPPFERSVYISLQKKRDNDYLRDAEWKYIKEYEDFIVTGD